MWPYMHMDIFSQSQINSTLQSSNMIIFLYFIITLNDFEDGKRQEFVVIMHTYLSMFEQAFVCM